MDRKSETPQSDARYLKIVNRIRIAVALAMAVCGAGFVLCANLDDYYTQTLRQEPGIWAAGGRAFEIGVLACLTTVFALIVENLARPTRFASFSLRSLVVRSLLILVAVSIVGYVMAGAYGFGQAAGAVIGTFLLLAAVRERRIPRYIFAFLAAIMIGLTWMGTQSSYQYACRHADEIIAAGCELMDRCPRTNDLAYNRQPEIDPSGDWVIIGQEIQPDDPRVPNVLRKLGAQRIWIDEERVAVYVGENIFDFSRFPRCEVEYQIYRDPHPDATENPVWGDRGKGATKIRDRLWSNDY